MQHNEFCMKIISYYLKIITIQKRLEITAVIYNWQA